ncbi:MAG: iron-sulfur cluster assembly scaffold protein [Hyphomicrobium sp.]|nr:iron-sulfur cluster assembly scaffold protein [Hyphomicrobium sp.]MBN9277874.1 iron-sulfur cluster assembly scaffold protein [Hyphomicrobium sp.]ODT18173.1 MAG: iron-sulfur cluster assembly scaffold protein [Hyphomicrobium sp. SCN 65-11]OJU27655.1 MAG: iron-sulfur cluster assembly scaffold protein [Alphaproteobacteria bacterium 64-6]
MTELSDLYSQRIIELAATIPPAGHLAAPDATASAHSKLCGSTIAIELAMNGDRVTEYAQTVKACLLGQASAAIMARNIVGSSDAELREVAAEMRRMLKENGTPPGGRWADLSALEPVREVKGRHASTLLAFEAVVRALDQIAEKRGAHEKVAARD